MGITTIFVTHDQEEAVVLADKVALILDGTMKQYDSPNVFYQRPVDEATARFFGGQNFVTGVASNGMFDCSLGSLQLPQGTKTGSGMLTFRPENIRITQDASQPNTFAATVSNKIYLGTQTRLQVRIGEQTIDVIANPNEVEHVEVNQSLQVCLPPESLWVLNS
jgi:ABC-type Fe3+/spermidine/putrescine transport system ATPase subunit